MIDARLPARLSIVLLTAALLQGCVAAVVPLAAGGIIGGKELGVGKKHKHKKHHRKDHRQQGEVQVQFASETATPAAKSAQAAPSERGHGAATTPASADGTYGKGNHPANRAKAKRAARALGFDVAHALPPVPGENAANTAAAEPAGYKAFYTFTVHKLATKPANGTRHSMLLINPPSLKPDLEPCDSKPPAVLIDLDPGNGVMPLTGSAHAVPGLARQLANLRADGVAIDWISARTSADAARIRAILARTRLDPKGTDRLLLVSRAGETKQTMRRALGNSNCLLAIVGDKRGDFDNLYDYLRDPAFALPLSPLIGHGWFLAPTPVN